MTTYVFKCEECGEELDREYPMGEAPDEVRMIDSDWDECRAGWHRVLRRVFVPVAHKWRRGGNPNNERIIDKAKAIESDPNYEVS